MQKRQREMFDYILRCWRLNTLHILKNVMIGQSSEFEKCDTLRSETRSETRPIYCKSITSRLFNLSIITFKALGVVSLLTYFKEHLWQNNIYFQTQYFILIQKYDRNRSYVPPTYLFALINDAYYRITNSYVISQKQL